LQLPSAASEEGNPAIQERKTRSIFQVKAVRFYKETQIISRGGGELEKLFKQRDLRFEPYRPYILQKDSVGAEKETTSLQDGEDLKKIRGSATSARKRKRRHGSRAKNGEGKEAPDKPGREIESARGGGLSAGQTGWGG